MRCFRGPKHDTLPLTVILNEVKNPQGTNDEYRC